MVTVTELQDWLQDAMAENDIRLYFVRKKANGEYNSYSPHISVGLHDTLYSIAFNTILSISDLEQRPFNPIGSITGTIETYDTNQVRNFVQVIESLNEQVVSREPLLAEDISKLNFYCLKISNSNEESMYLFRRVTKFNKLTKGFGFMGRFIEGRFEKLEGNLLGMDDAIDIIVFNEEMFILNHVSLERIFSIHEQYSQNAEQALLKIEQSGKIENFDSFKEDCLNDNRITRTLTKVLDTQDALDNVFVNFQNVVEVIDLFQLPIDLIDDNKILYQEKSQLLDIIRLIKDSYYRTLINQREGVDDL